MAESLVIGGEGLFQFHWQKIGEPTKTEFLEQAGPFKDDKEMDAWQDGLGKKYAGKCPEGWMPCVMNHECPQFVAAASPT